MRCLLVDDEPGIREGLAMLLRRRGHEVHTAEDCSTARAQLEAQEFDVVITDWRLPDGVASGFLGSCSCPVFAVSGHPEEVEAVAPIREVLGKPVRPAQLLERIAGCEREAPCEVRLAADVSRVIDDVLAQLPADVETRCHDDGTYVVLCARLPEGFVPTVRNLGGDLRIVEGPDGRELELRLCRDGRPDPETPVVGLGDPYPAAAEFAIDCTDTELDARRFTAQLTAVAEHHGRGGRICLLNVPERLERTMAVWESTHDMPMRARVGPRLSEELAELWS